MKKWLSILLILTLLCSLMGCANNTHRYFPTQNAYDYGSYEAVTSYFARGCGEMAAEKFVELLKELK